MLDSALGGLHRVLHDRRHRVRCLSQVFSDLAEGTLHAASFKGTSGPLNKVHPWVMVEFMIFEKKLVEIK